jgi:antagonist of KipI
MLKILKGGMLTSVQDLGRYGFQKYGVIASGAMDPFAHRIANLLVGNADNAATLEISLAGPSIEFEEDAVIALCGGDLSPQLDGKDCRMWRTLAVKKGCVLTFGAPKKGCRTYLATAGGFDVPDVMHSKSTYLRAAIGGFEGRALKTGDRVPLKTVDPKRMAALVKAASSGQEWQIPAIRYFNEPVVRIIKGRQFNLFDAASQARLFDGLFTVGAHSDRMGYRLEGAPLTLSEAKELISEPVAFGSIQVPPDGNPIVLMADRQTTGGYPKIGDVASIDLPLIGQLNPGDRIRFKEISLEEAQKRLIAQEQHIRQLKIGIDLKMEEWK